jgi:N-acetyltransferase 10
VCCDSCETCLVCDDELNVLPVTNAMRDLKPVARQDAEEERAAPLRELTALRAALLGHEPAHTLLSLAKTPAQVRRLAAAVVVSLCD